MYNVLIIRKNLVKMPLTKKTRARAFNQKKIMSTKRHGTSLLSNKREKSDKIQYSSPKLTSSEENFLILVFFTSGAAVVFLTNARARDFFNGVGRNEHKRYAWIRLCFLIRPLNGLRLCNVTCFIPL